MPYKFKITDSEGATEDVDVPDGAHITIMGPDGAEIRKIAVEAAHSIVEIRPARSAQLLAATGPRIPLSTRRRRHDEVGSKITRSTRR